MTVIGDRLAPLILDSLLPDHLAQHVERVSGMFETGGGLVTNQLRHG